jgi:hypothetical protein
MKHIRIYILLVGLLLGSQAVAQTSLYKTYVGRPGIKASCIENYPIGKGMKVTVTMLEARDSMAFRQLMRSLKAMPYNADKAKSDKSPKGKRVTVEYHDSWDSLALGESALNGILSHVKKMDMKVNVDTARDGKQWRGLSLHCADPLPGDEGQYLIYNSDDMMTALVFHCPTEAVYAQTVRYVLKTTMEKWKSN